MLNTPIDQEFAKEQLSWNCVDPTNIGNNNLPLKEVKMTVPFDSPSTEQVNNFKNEAEPGDAGEPASKIMT